MSTGLITAISANILVERCRRLGVSQKELLNHAGLSYKYIENPSGYISVEQMNSLWNSILYFTHDDMFALHAAENVPFGAYRVLDYMLALSLSPKDALARSSRSFGLVNSAFILSLRLHRDAACLELHALDKNQSVAQAHIEYILGNYLTRLRIVAQMHCKPVEVHFTFGPRPDMTEYHRVFGARVRFRQAINCMVFPQQLMEVQLPLADPELCEVLETYAKSKIANSAWSNPAFIEMRSALAHNLDTYNATLDLLSRQLARSRRSLQREIAAHGMTYRELLDSVRLERAMRFLKEQDLPIQEIAAKLNFADASSFCRAFKRWTGTSPLQHRNRRA